MAGVAALGAHPRWTLANMVPVIFMLMIVGTIWFLYVSVHLLPLLQLGYPEDAVHPDARRRGIVELCISQSLTLMLFICLGLAMFTDPGDVPRKQPWLPEDEAGVEHDEANKRLLEEELHESKHSGARRSCKWCSVFKPDRCHHCRICGRCVVRMDHHCPWIANCVGYMNHKYFLLLVFYALLTCGFIVTTMSESLYHAATSEMPLCKRFLIVFGMTLSVIMGILLKLFFGFHLWLMAKGATTIEFCEKMSRNTGSTWTYNCGLYQNICNVLGPNPLFWLLPISRPAGDGCWYSKSSSSRASETKRKESTLSASSDDFKPSPQSAIDESQEPERTPVASSSQEREQPEQ